MKLAVEFLVCMEVRVGTGVVERRRHYSQQVPTREREVSVITFVHSSGGETKDGGYLSAVVAQCRLAGTTTIFEATSSFAERLNATCDQVDGRLLCPGNYRDAGADRCSTAGGEVAMRSGEAYGINPGFRVLGGWPDRCRVQERARLAVSRGQMGGLGRHWVVGGRSTLLPHSDFPPLLAVGGACFPSLPCLPFCRKPALVCFGDAQQRHPQDCTIRLHCTYYRALRLHAPRSILQHH